jgi:curli production assembly/transport component CsgG
MKLYWPKACLAAVAVAFITGCAELPQEIEEPALPEVTQTRSSLLHLAPPKNRVDIAVYEFEDLSGQYKPSENFQSLSRAVSQGGGAVLIKALKDTGRGQWFRVVERTNLNNLLQERRIIQEMRQIYLKEKEVNPAALPPMLFAGVIVEGGVVGFDSNVETGGAGAALLGIGARTEYRRDTMSVNLRTVSVKTGEVLASVVVQKSVLSTSVGANVFRYVASDEILELETGVTENEPGLIALSRAIEKAIYALIMEMAQQDYWAFKDHAVGQQLINRYLEEDGRFRRPVPGDQAQLDAETSIEISAVTSASETTKTI